MEISMTTRTITVRPFKGGNEPTNLELPLDQYDVYEVDVDDKHYYLLKGKAEHMGVDIHVALYEVDGQLVEERTWGPDCGDTILYKSVEEQVEHLLEGRM